MRFKLLLFSCFLLLIISCKKETALDEYYNREGNFSGSIYDALDSSGLYKYFIDGVDSTEFANQLKHTLITVVAPSDKAFKAYLEKYGYSSISGIPTEELQDLIGQHIITWPHSPTSFEIDPYNFKRQSNMANRSITKYISDEDRDVEFVRQSKYLQFYFPEMLAQYGASANDYKLVTGSILSEKTGFNVYGAQVDSIVPYGNGWVYYVDSVIEPRESLDDWLLASNNYSLFSEIYNRYSITLPLKAQNGSDINPSINIKKSSLFQSDITYQTDAYLDYETVSSIRITLNAGSGYTVIAPNDKGLQNFIDTCFANYTGFKSELEIVDMNSMENLHVHKIARLLISSYIFNNRLLFPSAFVSSEGINGFEGTNIKLTDNEITEYKLCSNGLGYGINKYIVPRSFKSVMKPVTTTPDYTYFLAAVTKAKILNYLNSDSNNYTLMIPTDSAFIRSGIVMQSYPDFVNNGGTALEKQNQMQNEVIFVDTTVSNTTALTTQTLFDIIFNHVFIGNVTPGAQKQYILNARGDYVGMAQDSLWSGGNIEPRLLKDGSAESVKITKSFTGMDNGKAYVVNKLIKSATYSLGNMLITDTAYSRFSDVCQSSGLLTSNGTLKIYGNYSTVFVPTNSAMDQYISEGKLPADEESLQTFVKYFFVDKSVFTTETINETAKTLCLDPEQSTQFTSVYKTVELTGSPGNLTIKGNNNTGFLNVIEGNQSNIICTNGIIHQIDGVLN